jgi:hypothetical protein
MSQEVCGLVEFAVVGTTFHSRVVLFHVDDQMGEHFHNNSSCSTRTCMYICPGVIVFFLVCNASAGSVQGHVRTGHAILYILQRWPRNLCNT